MTSIIGIPTTRVSDLFIRQRLLDQVQFDQTELFRLQTQLSTGRQFELPSEAPVAALRVMRLQRLIEQRTQVQSNLQTNESYLNTTDAALSTVSGLLADIRGAALGVLGTTATDAEREAAAAEIHQTIFQLVNTGNQKFRGRYLFSGSTTQVEPFELAGADGVKYLGNEERLFSFSDIGLLFETNVPGENVFGALSEPIRGSVDLNPVLTYDTRLADLRGGVGIGPGSIAISDGSQLSIIDISPAATIGDVAALIHANPPEGRTLDVEVTPTGLVVQLDAAPGNLTIREVGGGTTAAELGLLEENGVGNDPLVGKDLDPILRTTTRLDEILGTRAQAAVRFPGDGNDFFLEADVTGDSLNGVTVNVVNDSAVSAGNEVVTYDALAGTIEIRIDENQTQTHHVVEAVNTAHGSGLLPFNAWADPVEADEGGIGFVAESVPAAVTSGGSGVPFDKTSGLEIRNGEHTYTISLATAETVEDVLNILNGSGAGVLAQINADRTGVDVRSRLSGADFALGENGGQTATQLGLRSLTDQTQLSELRFGRGVEDNEMTDGLDFTITRRDGVVIPIDLAGANTISDVLDRINSHPDNTPVLPGDPPALTAQLATIGNGIELVDTSTGLEELTVTKAFFSLAAIDLGLIAEDEESAVATTPGVLTGRDTGLLETEGIFTALIRLEQALIDSDLGEAERSIDMLDRQTLEMNFARAELGTKQQGLDALKNRLDIEEVELRSILSEEYDVDLVEVISNLTARQAALEASLKATAQTMQTSLMDYL